MPRVAILDQVAGVEAAIVRTKADLLAATARHDGREIARLAFELDCLEAAATTLRWLGRDREGCLRLMTTTWGE